MAWFSGLLPKGPIGFWLTANPASKKTLRVDASGQVTAEDIVAADVTGLSEAVDDRVNGLLVAGTNVTLTYDDTANTLTVAATGGGLTGVSSAENNGTQNTLSVSIAGHSQTNAWLDLQPKGNGGLYLGPAADGTATGGNARGTNSVDLQTQRTSPTHVASGVASLVSGRGNTSPGECSAAIGEFNSSDATNGFVTGRLGLLRGLIASRALGCQANSVSGERQQREGVLAGQTTDATTLVTLTCNGLSASTNNQFVLPNNATFQLALAVAFHQTTGSPAESVRRSAYTLHVVGGRGANAAATSIRQQWTDTMCNDLGIPDASKPIAVADTTNGLISVQVRGIAGQTLRAVARVLSLEVTS
jgi:hypothetical protein